jgi:putative membrane protein (TIGR04086 family)
MHKSKGSLTDGLAKSFLICFAISVILIILFSLLSALILGGLDDPTKNIGLFSLGAMMLSAIVSGVICARIKGESGMRFACLVGLAVVLTMLMINVIVCKGRVSLGAFMNYGCYLAAFILAAFLGKKRNGHRRHKH